MHEPLRASRRGQAQFHESMPSAWRGSCRTAERSMRDSCWTDERSIHESCRVAGQPMHESCGLRAPDQRHPSACSRPDFEKLTSFEKPFLKKGRKKRGREKHHKRNNFSEETQFNHLDYEKLVCKLRREKKEKDGDNQ